MDYKSCIDYFVDDFCDVVIDGFPSPFPFALDFDTFAHSFFNDFGDLVGVLSLLLKGEKLDGLVVFYLC